jgi:hypothetical protein
LNPWLFINCQYLLNSTFNAPTSRHSFKKVGNLSLSYKFQFPLENKMIVLELQTNSGIFRSEMCLSPRFSLSENQGKKVESIPLENGINFDQIKLINFGNELICLRDREISGRFLKRIFRSNRNRELGKKEHPKRRSKRK